MKDKESEPPSADNDLDRLRRENARLRTEVQALERYRDLAYRDPLTGLFNRRAFDEELSREIARATRERRTLGLVLVDIDRFKEVNDRLGHPAGDRVLCRVGTILRWDRRGWDSVCRIGGDEFAIILPGASPLGLEYIVRRLHRRFRSSLPGMGAHRVSIGSASFPSDSRLPSGLVAHADRSMYRDKEKTQRPDPKLPTLH